MQERTITTPPLSRLAFPSYEIGTFANNPTITATKTAATSFAIMTTSYNLHSEYLLLNERKSEPMTQIPSKSIRILPWKRTRVYYYVDGSGGGGVVQNECHLISTLGLSVKSRDLGKDVRDGL